MNAMRFLVDENVRKSVFNFLNEHGHDVVSVVEVALSAKDEDVLALAFKQDRILITNDKDFGELVFHRGHTTHGVILIRLHDESREAVLSHLATILEQYPEKLSGHFVVVSDFQARFHKL